MRPGEIPVTRLIHEVPGAGIRIEAVVIEDGSCPAEDFLNGLSDENIAKMMARFDTFIRAHPRRVSPEKFKMIEGTDLFEFKCFQIRMPCFYAPGRRLVLTHGLIKKADKLSSSEIEKAQRIRSTFERRRSSHG